MRSLSIAAVVVAAFGSGAIASPIEFIHTGIASGTVHVTLTPQDFSGAAFTIDAFGDTNNRTGTGNPFQIKVASISISGVGVFQVADDWFEQISSSSQEVMIFDPGSNQLIVAGPVEAALATWNMLSSIGPINGVALQISNSAFKVSDGFINNLNIAVGSGASFHAVVVPETASWCMMLLGIAAIGGVLWRSRMTEIRVDDVD